VRWCCHVTRNWRRRSKQWSHQLNQFDVERCDRPTDYFHRDRVDAVSFPGASMTFLDNGVAIPGSATALNQNGAASFTTTLAAGTHSIVAVLNTCCGNSSNAVSVTVVPAGAPALSLSVSALSGPSFDDWLCDLNEVLRNHSATGQMSGSEQLRVSGGLSPGKRRYRRVDSARPHSVSRSLP